MRNWFLHLPKYVLYNLIYLIKSLNLSEVIFEYGMWNLWVCGQRVNPSLVSALITSRVSFNLSNYPSLLRISRLNLSMSSTKGKAPAPAKHYPAPKAKQSRPKLVNPNQESQDTSLLLQPLKNTNTTPVPLHFSLISVCSPPFASSWIELRIIEARRRVSHKWKGYCNRQKLQRRKGSSNVLESWIGYSSV